MEPSQLNHLKEAAADIRRNLSTVTDVIIELKNIGDYEADVLTIKASSHVANIERALTRIEMCLKEIK